MRDDLETILYNLVFLLKGKLPWMGERDSQKVLKIKQQFLETPFCDSIPSNIFFNDLYREFYISIPICILSRIWIRTKL